MGGAQILKNATKATFPGTVPINDANVAAGCSLKLAGFWSKGTWRG